MCVTTVLATLFQLVQKGSLKIMDMPVTVVARDTYVIPTYPLSLL